LFNQENIAQLLNIFRTE